MDMRTFYKELKQGAVRTCYLLDGEEEYTKQKALDDLRDKLLSQ